MRLAVFTVALLFIVALAVLTARDIRMHGTTPVDVLAIVVLGPYGIAYFAGAAALGLPEVRAILGMFSRVSARF